MTYLEELDQTMAKITQLKATCQRLEAENAAGQRRIVELETTNAELLAACEALQQSLKQLRGGSLRRQVEEEEALELGRVAIAKARKEEKQ